MDKNNDVTMVSRRSLITTAGKAALGATLLGAAAPALPALAKSNGAQAVTLRFSFNQDPAEASNITKLVNGFRQTHPNVQVKLEPIAGGTGQGAYDQKILTEAAGGTISDLFWCADVYTVELAKRGVMLDLNPYLSKYHVDTSNMYSSMLQLGQVDGHQYVMPRDYNQVVTYYNEDAFKAAGLGMPSLNWTFDEFVQACQKLVSKGHMKYAIDANSTWWAVWVPFVRGFGGDVLSTDGKQFVFDSPEAMKGITALVDLTKNGYAVNPQKAPTQEAFMNGQAAMAFWVRPLDENFGATIKNKFRWNATRFPKLPVKPVIGTGMSGYAAAAHTKYPDLAAAFLGYIASPAGQKIFEETGNSVPVLKSLQNDPTWRNLPRPDFNNKAFFYDSQDATLPPEHNIPVTAVGPYDTAITNAFEAVFLGRANVDTAFKQAAQQVNGLLQGQ
jgi:multiple sugar transport system substrate-binding protein